MLEKPNKTPLHKIGIFSGAFDPIHYGHIAFAIAAKNQLGLEKVFLLSEQELRRKHNPSPYQARLHMCKLATADINTVEVLSLRQLQFSVKNTLPVLQKKFKDAQLVFLMGSDLFMRLPDWAEVKLLCESVQFAVGIRSGDKKTDLLKVAKILGAQADYIETEHAHMSSSYVRERLRNGQKAPIERSVAAYLAQEKLYDKEFSSEKA